MSETLGKYELRHILGKGAMGTVYEGFDPIIHRRLAIKTVRLPDAEDKEAQEELARFKREAQAAGRLSHPNIVGVFDYGETPELAYIVMEFVDGTTLKHIVDKKERFEIVEVVRLMEGLLQGLQYSHDRGVVHRDIKPANIMLTKAGEVKIADFGIARIESSSMTQAGMMLGTPSYMSPEQFMGQTVDARTDLYSSGVMLYQLLTGEKPFEGGLTAIMHKVLNTDPPPPSALSVTVPASFDAVVRKAMAKRPEDRFADAAEFAAALKSATFAKPAQQSAAAAFDGEATMVAGASEATMVAGPSMAPRSTYAAPQPATIATPKKGVPVALIGGGGAIAVALLAGLAFIFMGGHKSAPSVVVDTVAIAKSPAPPPLTADQIRPTLTGVLASLPCTFLSGAISGTQSGVTGLAGAGAPQVSLTAALQSIPPGSAPVANVQTFDGPYCDALNTIRPYHPLFQSPDSVLGLTLAGGKTTLYNGQLITIDETMPNYLGYLQTDYLSADGSVLHVYPTAANPLRKESANFAIQFPIGTVSAPFGTDMIISIASSTPLFSKLRPENENASSYLPVLRSALQDAASSGASVSVAAIPVITMQNAQQ